MRSLLQRLKRLSLDTQATLALGVFSLTYRLITLPLPRDGGDAMRKWMWGRLILAGWPHDAIWRGRWDHHAARVAINVPVLITQAIFGTHPNLIYAMPLLAHTLGVILVFKVAKRVCGFGPAFWTAALWSFLMSVEWAAQLMPEPFSAVYMLLCLYCLIRMAEQHQAQSGTGLGWLMGAAGAMSLAYLCKLPNLFFMPGLMFAIWWTTRNWKWAIGFGCVVAGVMLVESLVYYEFLKLPLGRISVIKGGHLKSHKMKEPIVSFWGFFSQYKPVFRDEMGPILALFLPVGTLCLVYFKRLSSGLQVVLVSVVSFLFFQTFAVQSIDPLLPVQPARSRYIAVVMSPMMIVLATCLVMFVRVQLPEKVRARPALMSGLVLVGLLTYGYMKYWPGFKMHPMAQLARYKRIADAGAEEGLPVIAYDYRSSTLMSYQALFWDGFDTPHNRKRRKLPRYYYYGKKWTKLWFTDPALKDRKLSMKQRRAWMKRWKGHEVLLMMHKPQWKLSLKRVRFKGH